MPQTRVGLPSIDGRTPRTLVIDGLLAVVVGTVVVACSALETSRLPPAPEILLIVCAVAALPACRAWPKAALAIVTASVSTYVALGHPPGAINVVVSIPIYGVAKRTSWRRALVAGALAFCAILVPYLFRAGQARTEQLWLAFPLIWMALLLPPALVVAVRLRKESVARAHAEEIRRRVEDERLEIAREVHDVLGHALAVIHMHAGVALHVSERRPGQVKDSLEAVGQASREALAELDATFGVFREAAAGRPDLGLAQLDALLAMMGRVGLDVELRVSGPRGVLSSEVERAAYRIVQESLTNVLHHADSTRATVDVQYTAEELTLRIANDGEWVRAVVPVVGNGGHGVPGMRQRAAALGGWLEAGPRPEGGFLVTACLPRRDCCP